LIRAGAGEEKEDEEDLASLEAEYEGAGGEAMVGYWTGEEEQTRKGEEGSALLAEIEKARTQGMMLMLTVRGGMYLMLLRI
jgi:hypothetical protein